MAGPFVAITRACRWVWRHRDTLVALVGVAALCWALVASYQSSHRAEQLSRQVAQVTADQAVAACAADNRTRAEVAHALSRVVDDVDAITDDPSTEQVLADLRHYIETALAPRECAIPATIDGVHG